jgi:hypothetical protein
MLAHALLVLHIAVVGYWLGSEFVINSTYRHVTYAQGMPFPERKRLMQHVMNADQHVRYALVLQAGLGSMLAFFLGYLSGGAPAAVISGIAMVLWLGLVEITHRMAGTPAGERLAAIDRGLRYLAFATLLVGFITGVFQLVSIPLWLAIKLLLFAGVIACGVGIRFALMAFFHVWNEIERDGSTDARESAIRRVYVQATGILVGLWACIAGIVVLSVVKLP